MKTSRRLLTFLALMFAVVLPLHAQDGCANSPENPTVILANSGSAGAFLTTAQIARLKSLGFLLS